MTTTTFIVFFLTYALGFFLSYRMQKIEHESEEKPYTHGTMTLNICLSLLSFAWVLFILITTWIGMIKQTGYWDRPVKPVITKNDPE